MSDEVAQRVIKLHGRLPLEEASVLDEKRHRHERDQNQLNLGGEDTLENDDQVKDAFHFIDDLVEDTAMEKLQKNGQQKNM